MAATDFTGSVGTCRALHFAQEEGPTTTYKFGGYAKFDAMFTDYSDATPDGNSPHSSVLLGARGPDW